MERITNFLNNPRTTGLHVLIYKIELSKIAEFYDYAKENYKIETHQTLENGNEIINEFIEREKREEKSGNRFLSGRLGEALARIILKEDKPEICDYFKVSPEELENSRKEEGYQGLRRTQRLFRRFLESNIFHKHLDVLYMNYRISKDEKTMLIELVSLNEIGFKIFDDFIFCLPILKDSFKKISLRKSHSERYTFKLYDLVVQLWIHLEDKFLFNDNIANLLTASIIYYAEEEWITSIVLNSIAVEIIFAELYEEEYKENAPDIPLGALIQKVKEKISFQIDLLDKVHALNQVRIASVHRSENPVSDKDTIISMMGITSLIIWYFDNY